MTTAPQQAVILAGGRGERIRPLSDLRPKPMIEVAGKPFLEHLLLEVRRVGLKHVLILTGYLGEVIRDYFGNGERLGLEITYHQSPEDYDTGARLRAAKTLIESSFLLLYADNLWPMPWAKMQAAFLESQCPAQLTLYRNDDHYSRANARLEGGKVAVYDKSRQQSGLSHVDIGFLIARREVLDLLPEGNVNFEASLYPLLAAKGQLAAYEARHRYYSATSPDRLPRVAAFLSERPTILLDRDGVLNRKAPQGTYVTSWEDFHWCDGALDALTALRRKNYRVIIVSNQAGIARGVTSHTAVQALHRQMSQQVEAAGGYIDAIYYCPHHWDDGCECRKPLPGMFFTAQRDFTLNLSRCLYVGDDPRDAIAAEAADCPFLQVEADGNLAEALAAAGIL